MRALNRARMTFADVEGKYMDIGWIWKYLCAWQIGYSTLGSKHITLRFICIVRDWQMSCNKAGQSSIILLEQLTTLRGLIIVTSTLTLTSAHHGRQHSLSQPAVTTAKQSSYVGQLSGLRSKNSSRSLLICGRDTSD